MAYCIKCNETIDNSPYICKPKYWFQTYCESCNKAHNKLVRPVPETTKRKNAQTRKNRIDDITIKIINYLESHPCVDCQNNDIRVLEFDHQLNKLFNISSMIQNNSWELICEEIIKCEVRCANCHRIKTHRERNSRKHRFDILPPNMIE